MKSLFGLAVAATLAALAAGGAAAQQRSDPYRMDPNAPMDFSADEADAFNQATCTSSLRGRVEIMQDKTRVRARELKAFHQRGKECRGGIDRWEAKGEVFYVTPDQRIRSDAAVYDNAGETATFTGNVVAVQGDDVTTGQTLVVDLKTNAFKLSGRVRGVFSPEPRDGKAR